MAKYKLKLYILGYTATAKKAIANLDEICQLPILNGVYEVEVINLLEHPQLAESEKIMATPLLIKKLPPPLRRIVGDLSDHDKVLVGLDVCRVE
jgi:circadian clock protein KaiB